MNEEFTEVSLTEEAKDENTETTESELSEAEETLSAEKSDNASSVIDDDLSELREEFPELRDLESIDGLNNFIRYAALRDLGLSPAEAYILTARRSREYDNRSHLTSSVPVSAKSPSYGMSTRELEEAREIFGDISDAEIHKLYKKVTK